VREERIKDLRVRRNTIKKQFFEEVKQELEDFITDYKVGECYEEREKER